jgi:hypothetical protein
MNRKAYTALICFLICLVFCGIYFYFCKNEAIQIPVVFTTSQAPAFKVCINKKPYYLEFDLGSKLQLSLTEDVLSSVNNKESIDSVHWRDVQGNHYQSPSYLIDKIQIENLIFKDIVVKQENDEFNEKCTLWIEKGNYIKTKKIVGKIGRPLLEKTNLVLDFAHSKMIACNDKKQLKKHDIDLEKMTRISFKTGKTGIIINTHTDLGPLRMGLDTGATGSAIRKTCLRDQMNTFEKHGYSFFTSTKFLICDVDFGPNDLLLFDITPELDELDGFLGMDFLKKHIIYIDYVEKFIYIEKSQAATT